MLKWWAYIIVGVFLIDLIYRTFFEQRINLKSMKTKKISQSNKESEPNLNISKFEKSSPTHYDKKKFDPEVIHFYSQQNTNKNDKQIYYEDDEDDDIVYPSKGINNKNIDDDEIEFEGLIPKPKRRINVTIEYDDKYQNLYDELSSQLDGNLTYLSFYPKLAEMNGNKKVIRYFLFFSMGVFCLCFTFIERIMNYCCNSMPESLKSFISVIKFFLSGGSYLFHMYFIKKVSHSNMFEVYVEQKLKYSTLKRDEPPTYVILFNILKEIQSKQ